ncbi:GATA type transcriptional activator of nitrogen-regulated proteins [Coemansia sp. RSA 2399]|nr:GATA type transcriptional activator of nitrogen-regulated proteins [Coemansia sp. RSA 2399]
MTHCTDDSVRHEQLHLCKDSRLSISALLQGPPPSFAENTSDVWRSSAFIASADTKEPSFSPSSSSSSPSPVVPITPFEIVANEPQPSAHFVNRETQTSSGALRAQQTISGSAAPISCANCKTTTTPLWRRDPTTGFHLCNRCGLYLKTYNVMHPLTRIKRRPIGSVAGSPKTHAANPLNNGCAPTSSCNDSSTEATMDDVEQVPRPANCNPPELQYLPKTQHRPKQRRITPKQQISLGMTPKCFNCSADKTPLWRRDPQDNIICNACGLYYKLHGKARPVSMKRAAIRRRHRTTLSSESGRQQQLQAVSVPAAEGGSVARVAVISGQPDEKTCMGGLDFLMQAAELRLSPQNDNTISARQRPCSAIARKDGKPPCDLRLESLANIAMAEMMGMSGDDQKSRPPQQLRHHEPETASREAKENLRLECQRLEQLLAQSRAKLGSLDEEKAMVDAS